MKKRPKYKRGDILEHWFFWGGDEEDPTQETSVKYYIVVDVNEGYYKFYSDRGRIMSLQIGPIDNPNLVYSRKMRAYHGWRRISK